MRTQRALIAAALALAAVAARAQAPAVPDSASVAGAPEEQTVRLSPFQVNANNDQGYGAANTVGATRVNTSIFDTPLSVVVANQAFLQDLDATESYQALRFVAGVSGAGAPYSGQMTLRGQNLPGTTFRDGVPDIASTGGAEMIDLGLSDRIEAIEGPAGTLYGISSSGGVINVVSKAPQSTPFNMAKITVGSWNVRRAELDSTGPLDDSKRFTYRVYFADQSGTISMGGPDNAIVAGVMGKYTFADGKDTLLLRVTYQDITRGTNEYPWFDDKAGNISTFLSRTNPITEKDAYREHMTTRVDSDFTRSFSALGVDWSARAVGRYAHMYNLVSRLYEQADSFYQFFDASGAKIGDRTNTLFSNPNIADIQVVQRTRSPAKSWMDSGIADADLVGKFTTGPIEHELLVYAFEQSLREYDYKVSGPYPGIDLFHPVYYANPNAVAGAAVVSQNLLSYNIVQAAAFQETAKMFKNRLDIVIGGRYDRKTQSSQDHIANVSIYNDVRAGTSRKLGLVVQPTEWASVYYDYSEVFNPSTFNQFTGAKYPNLLSKNNEAGLKISAMHGALVVNNAVFRTTTDNIIISFGNYIGPGGLLTGINGPGGTLRTDGWESDGTYSWGKNLAIIGGFGSLNSKTQTGAYARAVPLGFNYKGFAKWTFTDGAIAGVYVGYGYEHDSRRNGDGTIGGFMMPAYNVQNAVIGYRIKVWNFQLNCENLADATYPTIAVAGSIIYAGQPRNYQFSTSYTW